MRRIAGYYGNYSGERFFFFFSILAIELHTETHHDIHTHTRGHHVIMAETLNGGTDEKAALHLQPMDVDDSGDW